MRVSEAERGNFVAGMIPDRWMRSSAGMFLFLVFLVIACGSPQAPPSVTPKPEAAAESSVSPSPIRLPEIGFASRQKLVDHFRKHGREFGSITMEQYLRKAQELRDRPAGKRLLESIRPDGVVTRYDRETGDFIAFNGNGVIRTYFRPADGEAYFKRQVQRKH
jgi:hypothetical protein